MIPRAFPSGHFRTHQLYECAQFHPLKMQFQAWLLRGDETGHKATWVFTWPFVYLKYTQASSSGVLFQIIYLIFQMLKIVFMIPMFCSNVQFNFLSLQVCFPDQIFLLFLLVNKFRYHFLNCIFYAALQNCFKVGILFYFWNYLWDKFFSFNMRRLFPSFGFMAGRLCHSYTIQCYTTYHLLGCSKYWLGLIGLAQKLKARDSKISWIHLSCMRSNSWG